MTIWFRLAIGLLCAVTPVTIVSCVGPAGMSQGLSSDFHRAAEEERAVSARCLSDRIKYGPVRAGMMEQDGAIILEKWCGTLIKQIDQESRGSFDKQRAILQSEVRANGKLFILRELNRYYHVMGIEEFTQAANNSGKEPSIFYSEPR